MKFCKYCGSKIDDQAVMCPNCKRTLNNEFLLTITRDSQFMLIKSKIKVDVDHAKTYEINNGERLQIKLPRGNHNLYFHYSFRSKSVDINLSKNLNLSLGWDRVSGAIEVFEIV